MSEVEPFLEGAKCKQLIKPFLKWAGGKQSIINQLMEVTKLSQGLPPDLVEVCVGSGAFSLAWRTEYPSSSIELWDIKPALINLWARVLRNPREFCSVLAFETVVFQDVSTPEAYQRLRSSFNELNSSSCTAGGRFAAAQMLMLNKTCFNGLWRENSKGQMNVPWGKRPFNLAATALLLDAASKHLTETGSVCAKVQDILTAELPTDKLIYIDPPYLSLQGEGQFSSYDKTGFGIQEHIALSEKLMSTPNIKYMVSHSAHPVIQELYGDDHRYTSIEVPRRISCKGDRTPVTEWVITNF
jgi:DNA adenine methylase